MSTWQNFNSFPRVNKAKHHLLLSLSCHLSPTSRQSYMSSSTEAHCVALPYCNHNFVFIHLSACFSLGCTHFEGQSFLRNGAVTWRQYTCTSTHRTIEVAYMKRHCKLSSSQEVQVLLYGTYTSFATLKIGT